ncbi:MAG: hypothetical protein J7L37_05410 [Thermococcus sp.]|nr:hypothetical protein [Thermococcus sp.]
MGRLYTLFRWEMNDVVKNVFLLFGVLLAGMAMKQSVMDVSSSIIYSHGTEIRLFGASEARGVSSNIERLLTLSDVWTLLGFLILLLGALTFRYDRDSGVARSVYSLPYSNTEIFGVKVLSLIIYGFTLALLPFAYVSLTTYASIAGHLPEITSSFIGEALVLVAFLVLYLMAVATLASLAAPNAFLAFIIGFAVIYAPHVTGSSEIPPELFIRAIIRRGRDNCTPFTARYIGWGTLVPLVLFAVSWILIKRRDVV